MKMRCKIFGHKAKSLSPLFPTYCSRCLEDLSRNDKGKWVADPNVFDEMFQESITEELLKVSNTYDLYKGMLEENKDTFTLEEEHNKEATGNDIARRLTVIRLMMGPEISRKEEVEIYNRIYGSEGKISE